MKQLLFSLFFLLAFSSLQAQEICNNGIDDDNDGLVDLNDLVDCNCASSVPSLIPNPSFELMNCCPTSFSQVNCATSWIQASSATSDYLNTCGYVFPACIAAGLVPFPNGNGILGCIFSPGWQEYVGACLTSPMLAGTPYTLQMDIASTPIDNMGNVCNNGIITFGPVNVILYGTTNCANLPFAGTGCPPSPQFVILGQFLYTPVSNWGVITITFTPTVNITGIVIGSPCVLPASYTPPSGCYPYFYFDNLLLNTSTSFNTVSQSGTQCANNIVLTSSIVPTATYQWYLNGVALVGQTNSTLNISTNGFPPGNYTVVVTTSAGCSEASSVVLPSASLVATFTNTTVCVGASTTFIDNSTTASGIITGWSWNFGDPASAPNNTSILQNPSHVFSTAGTYNVTLIVTASNGCTNTIVIQVVVTPMPLPSFTYIQTCAGQSVNFTSTSTATAPSTITSTSWNFGDPASAGNNTSSLTNPVHNFTTLGNYVVTLIVTSSAGCSQTITQNISVTIPSVAAFIATAVCTNTPMSFTNQSVNSTVYHWDFGDLMLTNDTSNLLNPIYTFVNSGTFLVSLITNPGPCADTATMSFTINPGPAVFFSAPNVCAGSLTSFTDLSTISSGNISSWSWNFGNPIVTNDVSSLQNPTYLYTTSGTFNVTLICTSANGCVSLITIPVFVNTVPVANFNAISSCLGTATIFNDLSVPTTGVVTNWVWDFGDGSPISNQQNPSHIFLNDTTFNVMLIVTNTAGCIDTVIIPVIVSPLPVVAFSADTLIGCPLFCVNFTDLSTISNGVITAWAWDFGDASLPSPMQNPSHCYATSGTYSVTLVAVGTGGCTSTLTIPNMITVQPVPHADFTATPNPTIVLSPIVTFTDLSTGNPSTWSWDFGDLTSVLDVANTQNAQYTYSAEVGGVYQVNLVVTNQFGCVDDTTIEIIVAPDFAFFIPNSFTPNGDGKNDGFFGSGYGITDYQIWIFDRWGNLVFTSTDINKEWDGTVLGLGDVVQNDVYVWKVMLSDIFYKKHKYIGHVTVIK